MALDLAADARKVTDNYFWPMTHKSPYKVENLSGVLGEDTDNSKILGQPRPAVTKIQARVFPMRCSEPRPAKARFFNSGIA